MHLTDYHPRNLTNKLASLFLSALQTHSRHFSEWMIEDSTFEESY